VVILLVDLVVPGYAIAGAYLVLVVVAAFALPRWSAIAIAAVGLALTLATMAIQGRMNGENLLLVWFGVLAGAGVFALVAVYDSVESLFTAQQQSLQRESFLVGLVDTLRPLGEPFEVEATTTRLFGDQIEARWTAFCEVDEVGRLTARQTHERGDTGMGPDLELLAAGLAGSDGRALKQPGAQPCLAAPILEDGELVAAVVVCDGPAREWTEGEADLLEESAARAWTEVRRARSDAALRETESRLRDTLDSTADGLYRFNVRTGLFDYVSPSIISMTGSSMDEFMRLDGQLALSNIHPDDRAAAAAATVKLETEGVADLECRWALKGAYRWYSGVIRLTRDERGEPLFSTGTFRDITEHKRRERNVTFIAELQDELAQVTSAQDVMDVTGSRLGRELDVRHVYLTQYESGRQDEMVYMIWDDGQAPPPPTKGRLADFVTGEVLTALRDGQTVVCHDTETDPRVHADAYRAAGIRSWVMAPFRHGGDLAFTFGVSEAEAREWRDDEVELLRDVAVRTLPRLERARAEEALRSSEARFRTIVTTANEGISLMDSQHRITFVNEVFAESLGFTPEEIVGRRPYDLSADGDAGKLDAELRGRPEGRVGSYDIRLEAKSGETRWFLVSASPILDANDQFAGAVALFTDIDARKKQEAALALQAHLLENVHDAICALDSSYNVIYWNEAAEDLFGWTRDEAAGRPIRELLTRVPDSTWDDALETLLRDGSYRGEVLSTHKDGRETWVDVHSRLVRTEAGDVEGVVIAFRDIGEQKRSQEALVWEAARLRAIVETAPVGLGIVAADGEVILRNDVLRRIWMGELDVQSVDDYADYPAYWPETGQRLKAEEWPAAQALKNGRTFRDVVVDIDRFDGTRGTIVLSTAPIEDNGMILGAVTIAQDITDMREAEQALRFLTDEVRTLHEAVVLDERRSSTELACDVVAQAGLLLGSDGSSIFLLAESGALRRVAGVGVPDAPGVDDLVAQTIGDKAATVQPLPPPAREAAESPGRVMLAVPLVIRAEVFGAMAFTYENRRSLDDHQIRIARAFADQAALAIENARLRARIEETAVEAERTRLARDLHDSVTQSLFAASLKAEALAGLLGDPRKATAAVEELRRLTRGSLAGMRTMLLEMRADALQQTPLPELLRHLVEASGSRIGADVRLTVEGSRQQLPPDVQTAFYRIAQEALNNVARHARATEVGVDLRLGEDGLELRVGDDGLGFDAGQEWAGHFGLRNMRERAEAVGAGFAIDSGPGRGTVVTVEWPLGEAEGDNE
jgi:PAS domain S-box-containing protein